MIKINDYRLDLAAAKSLCLCFCAFALVMVILPNIAMASASGGTDAISQVLCNVLGQLQGGIGKGIATIAIIVLGIGLFLGKLSWPLALATALGIGLIFGAASVVSWVTSNTSGIGTAGSCTSS